MPPSFGLAKTKKSIVSLCVNVFVWYKDSALQLSLGGIYFGGIQLVLSFCASMMAAPRQVDELRGGVARWRSLRLGMRGDARRGP